MKTAFAILCALVVTGCASNGQEARYVNYGQIKGDPVRIPPCNPFPADELMAWATELEGRSYQDRKARVSVDADGRVRCRSREAAGSRTWSR